MTNPPWRLIPHETNEGSSNLAFDARLLTGNFPFPILRFYSWNSPCISYGYFQTPPEVGNLPAYRRITGGGIVFHDKDLTYSLTYPRRTPLPWSIRRSYLEIHRVIQRSLATLGVSAVQCAVDRPGNFCFESPIEGDLLYHGKKIAGAAQRRMGNRLLHQGTLLIDRLDVERLQLMDAMIEEFERTYQIRFVELWEKESSLSKTELMKAPG